MLPEHNKLALLPFGTPDVDFSAMAKDSNSQSKRDKSHDFSVFRTGHSADPSALDIDVDVGRDAFLDPYPLALFNPARVWESLARVELEPRILERNNLFTRTDESPAGPAFELLRTRVAQAMAEKGWRRLGVTSPRHGCGKSFTAANLALSLARRPGSRTVLVDMDLRRPSLDSLLGLEPNGPLREFLDGSQPLESLFVRIGKSLAVGLNATPLEDASDVLHAPDTADALAAMETQLDPELTIFDLPPALVGDDVIAMAGKVDAVLLVIDGTKTTKRDISACEALFDGKLPLLGVVLNRAQDFGLSGLRYGKG